MLEKECPEISALRLRRDGVQASESPDEDILADVIDLGMSLEPMAHPGQDKTSQLRQVLKDQFRPDECGSSPGSGNEIGLFAITCQIPLQRSLLR